MRFAFPVRSVKTAAAPAVCICVGSVMLTLSAPAAVHAQISYNLQIVAQTGDVVDGNTISFINGDPVLGNDGGISFNAGYSNGSGGANGGIFEADSSGNLDILALSNSVLSGTTLRGISPTAPVTRGIGGTVFAAQYADSNDTNRVGIFNQNGLIAGYGQDIDGARLSHIAPSFYAVNDVGGAAFGANTFSNVLTLFTATDRVVGIGDAIAGETLTGFESDAGLRLNNNGEMAFFARFDPDGPTPEIVGLFTQNALLGRESRFGIIDPDIAAQDFRLTAPFGFNDSGDFAYRAYLFERADTGNSNYEGIVNRGGVVVRSGNTIGGLRISNFFEEAGVSLNNGGTIAFLAPADDISRVIFTQNDVVARRGDTVDGLTIAEMENTITPSINDAGAIAFRASLSDGSQAIILATPVSSAAAAPEPGTLGLMYCTASAGAAFLTARRVRRMLRAQRVTTC